MPLTEEDYQSRKAKLSAAARTKLETLSREEQEKWLLNAGMQFIIHNVVQQLIHPPAKVEQKPEPKPEPDDDSDSSSDIEGCAPWGFPGGTLWD